MSGAIWYSSSFQRGEEQMNKIIKEYKLIGISTTHIIHKGIAYVVFFENGDTWSLQTAESFKGLRVNISLIESCISKDYIEKIIYPCTSAHPFTAINFWE